MRRIDDDATSPPRSLEAGLCLDLMPAAGGRTGSPAITRHYYELPRWACVHGMAENARA
jgi:hypothetical protein